MKNSLFARLLALILILVNFCWVVPIYAEVQPKDSYLNRISDWFATVGKSQEKKYLITNKRRRDRKIKKAKKKIEKNKREYFKLRESRQKQK